MISVRGKEKRSGCKHEMPPENVLKIHSHSPRREQVLYH